MNKHNLSIHQGETWTADFTWQDSNGDVIDLSSYTARMQVRRDYADVDTTDPIIDLSDGQGIELDAEGTILISLSHEDTSDLPAGEYVYDLEMTVEDQVTKLLRGSVTVFPEVTR